MKIFSDMAYDEGVALLETVVGAVGIKERCDEHKF